MSTTSAPVFVKKSLEWSIALSALMILAGVLAIASPLVAGFAVDTYIAWLLVFSGCVHLVFAWYRPGTGESLWELLIGILYIVVGAYLLVHPASGLKSLTIVLAIYLFLEAVLEFILGFTLRPLPGSGWLVLDGIVTLILAAMMWRLWPPATRWGIGTLLGVSMVFSGVSRLAILLAARGLTSKA